MEELIKKHGLPIALAFLSILNAAIGGPIWISGWLLFFVFLILA